MELTDRQQTILLASLEGKYSSSIKKAERSELAAASFSRCRELSEQELISATTPTHDVVSDIANQVRCFLLIEKFWRFRKPCLNFISHLHSVVMGLPFQSIALRATDSVADFPGIIPMSVDEVTTGMIEIERHLALIQEFAQQTDNEKAGYLAKLFGLIIRVHPFPDGNGRTARMAVQYCLRCWGYDYLVIPKVRNDVAWKEALGMAINGDYKLLTLYFLTRLHRLDSSA